MTACFAIMVGPQGCAVGVEHIPELVASSIKNIEKSAAAPLLKEGSLSVHAGGMYSSGTGYIELYCTLDHKTKFSVESAHLLALKRVCWLSELFFY